MRYYGYYHCNLCGEKYYSLMTENKEIALNGALQAINSSIKPVEKIISAPEPLAIHFCEDGSYGVADFIGFKYEEN